MIKKFTTNRLLNLFLFSFFVLIIFLLTQSPIIDPDQWGHIKFGEIYSHLGIINHDVFSQAPMSRGWIPYEWGFQVFLYQFAKFFGVDSMPYFIAVFATLQILAIYAFSRKIIKLDNFSSIYLGVLYLVFNYNGFSPRPSLLVFLFLIINLFLILNYLQKGRNLLLISLPITLFWANIHGSIIINNYLFISYFFICLFIFHKTKEREWKNKTKILGVYSILTVALTILPPLGFTQYRYLWLFFENRSIISNFVNEWKPLFYFSEEFIIYTIYSSVALVMFYIFILYKKPTLKWLIWLPTIPLIIFGFTAIRNTFYGYLVITIILGLIIREIKTLKLSIFWKLILTSFFIVILLLRSIILISRVQTGVFIYPEKATQFVKNNKLSGNMFNQYGMGDYLLYNLYPQQKVFIDGRTDVYLCCEIPDYLQLLAKINLPDNQFGKGLYTLFDKYQISYTILVWKDHLFGDKITSILSKDPNWALVFFTDRSVIFVKKDGKNIDLLNKYEFTAANPFGDSTTKNGLEDKAKLEYEKMDKIAPSSLSRNALGLIALKNKDTFLAKDYFNKALSLDKGYWPAYINLAQLALAQNNNTEAINNYLLAIKYAPDNLVIYEDLAQVYVQNNNIKAANDILHKALFKAKTDYDKKGIQGSINSLNYHP